MLQMEEIMKYALLVLPLFIAPALANEILDFDVPSHNMCCSYVPAGGTANHSTLDGTDELTCSRVKPKYWIVSLTTGGMMKVYKNPGEVPGCGNPTILGYGESRDYGDFNCTSETTGLTCLNAAGKGFKLSKSGLKKIKP
jgi:hypothetical protein